MPHSKRQIEPRGVVPPRYLVDYVRSEIDRIGDDELAKRVGITRTPLLRVAVGSLTVHQGTVAAVELDYRSRLAA